MENIYKTILEDTLAGYWDWNIPENTEYLSPTFKSMFGYEDHELENTPETWQKLIFKEDLDVVLKNYDEHVQSKGAVPYKNQVRYQHKNGSTVWVLCTGRVIEWNGDQPVRMVGCHIDITPQKKAEEELVSTQVFLSKTNEVAQIGAWEADLVGNKLLWTPLTRKIHEVDDDFTPEVDKGIKFYKKGYSRNKISEVFGKLVSDGTPFDEELQIVTALGNERWIRTIGQAEFIDGKCVKAYGTFQDIDAQRRMRDELAQSEQRLSESFDNAAIGMSLVELEGEWLRVNKQLSEIVGYSKKELLTKKIQDITHPEDIHQDLSNKQMLLEGKIDSYQLEKRYIHKYGYPVWVLISVSLVRDIDGKPIHFVTQIEDINEKKNAQENLSQSEQRFRESFDNSAIGMALVSLEGTWLQVNKQICEITGYPKEELLTKTFQEITHAEDLESDLTNVQMLLDGKIESYQMEKRYIHKQGYIVWVLLSVSLVRKTSGEPVHFVSQIEDITEKKQAQEQLQQVNSELKALFESITHVSVISTDLDGVIKHFSKGSETLLGYTADEMIDKNTPAIIHLEEEVVERGKELSKEFNREIAGFDVFVTYARQGKYESREWTYVRKDGSTFSVQLVVTPITAADGTTTGFLGIATDISQLKESEEQLRSTIDIVSEQNKRLFNFAHIVSHNLKSHTGNLDLLLTLYKDSADDSEKDELFGHLNSVSHNLTETITHLNEVVTIQTNINNQRKELNLYTLIENTLEILSGEINHTNSTIHINVPKDSTVRYNEAYLESILLNLMSNAIKYRSPDRSPVINVELSEDENQKQLSISDNGRGIDLDRHQHKLFGMYKTFHGNDDAKGIGLFITKNQIEAMGGKINVESTVGEGTTFTVYL